MSVHNSVVVITGCFTLVCVGWIMPYSWPIFCVCHTEVINRKKNRFAELLPIFLDCFFLLCVAELMFLSFFLSAGYEASPRWTVCWWSIIILFFRRCGPLSPCIICIVSYMHGTLLPLHAVCCFVLNFFLPHMAIKIKTERRIAYGTCISQTYSDFQIYWWSRHLNTRWSLLLLQAFGSWYIQHHKQTLNRFTTWQMIKICTQKKIQNPHKGGQ